MKNPHLQSQTQPMNELTKKRVTIQVPVYNEQEALPLFFKRIKEVLAPFKNQYDFELLFINDGSTDHTLTLLEAMRLAHPEVNYIDLSRNYGKEIGMLAGFDHARGDCVITIDADLQEPPEVIPQMLAKWEDGYDDVYGKRVASLQSFFKRHTSRLYHRLLAGMSRDANFVDNAGDFRLLDRKCVDAICQLRETQRYTKGLYEIMGFRKTPVDYEVAKRVAGSTKWSPGKLLGLAINGILSHSVIPLRLASYMGMIVSVCAFVYLVVVLVKALIWGDPVAGYPTIVSLILFIGGFILLSLGIIGEYLGKIFMETKHRPPYFITSINGERPHQQLLNKL